MTMKPYGIWIFEVRSKRWGEDYARHTSRGRARKENKREVSEGLQDYESEKKWGDEI
jgi:hypothetical protein